MKVKDLDSSNAYYDEMRNEIVGNTAVDGTLGILQNNGHFGSISHRIFISFRKQLQNPVLHW